MTSQDGVITEQSEPSGADFRFEVFGDFICPWSFAVVEIVDRLAAKNQVKPRWRPHALRPETPLEGMRVPADVDRRAATQEWIKDVAPEAAARMRYPDRIQHSFLAFQALEFANDRGLGWTYKSAVFDALWVQGADIADVGVLRRAAEEVGLDADELGQALESEAYRARAEDAVQAARDLEVTGTPTLFLGRVRINGFHYYEVLDDIIAKQLAA
jgi:predicted DsbA family dithiol-disulfide isomerase